LSQRCESGLGLDYLLPRSWLGKWWANVRDNLVIEKETMKDERRKEGNALRQDLPAGERVGTGHHPEHKQG